MQGMVEDTGESAHQEQYVIHPTKSGVLLYSNGVESTFNQLGFDMDGWKKKSNLRVIVTIWAYSETYCKKLILEEDKPRKKDGIRIAGRGSAFREWADETFMCPLMVYICDPARGIWS